MRKQYTLSGVTRRAPVIIVRPARRRVDDREQAVTLLPPVEVRQDVQVMRFLMVLLAVGRHDECRKMSARRLATFASDGTLGTQQRSCLGSARSIFTTEKFHKLVNLISGWEVFREKICRVHIPSDLSHLDRSRPNFLLHPESVSLQMPKLPESGSRRDTDGCARVSPDPDRSLQPEVEHNRLVAQACASSVDQAVKLILPRRQCV